MHDDNQHLTAYRTWGNDVPHQRAIGFALVELTPAYAIGRVSYRDEHVGNPVTGVVHGGIVTTLLDTVGGAAVMGRIGEPCALATLDLRIDYLRPSTPRHDLLARVECYKLTRNVAFTRGMAYNADPADPLASMSATYMLHTPTQRRGDSGASHHA